MIDPHLPETAPTTTTTRTLRQFAVLCLLVFALLGYWQGWSRGNAATGWVFAVLAVVLGLGGLAWPQLVRPVFAGLSAITFPIGWVLSHVLLALLYFGLFTPLALLFRLIGRDALALRRRVDRPTYWATKPMPTDLKSYFRPS